ncbi:copper amine oxidase domain-containing protein [Proteiniborus sp. DW1]|uniref:copper amine oxidase N-terminal domain-containing protein n=1 Tax=Proteiniborus sp. DW1 TaxID=1889883 RepID=UPI00092DEEE9|nr:copper amine oxidase N-terminal domain-containing protein [Proteiniborus sp. DW1]SCG81805.1 copper amine oxidase domain-containing protein [Proteiniborus sp. DW1]
MKALPKKKKAVIVTTVLALTMFLTSVAFAQGTYKNLKAWFGDIKIFVNNQLVQMDVKPFIVDGTTYVPVRAISNIFNKDIKWDGANLRIDITDRPNQNDAYVTYLSQQLIERQNKINELETKVAKLEAELATTKKGSKYTFSQLEDYLNDEHGVYQKISFDIELYGDKDDIEVEIYVDLDDDYSRWNSLTTSKIEGYIEDVVDDILYNFKDADITGFIEDSHEDEVLVEFYLNSKGKLVVEIKEHRYAYDIDELEDYLNRKHDYYGGVYFDITLSGNKDMIRVYVETDDDDLDYLKKYEIEDYLEKLYSEIVYEYSYVDVYGYIKDDYTKYYFDFDSRGNVHMEEN